MSIAIILRNQMAPNIFRDLLLRGIKLPNLTEIIFCSGFYQESGNSNYNVSLEGGLAHSLSNSRAKVITVGVHSYAWRQSFVDFNKALTTAGVNVTTRKVRGDKWHAKVFIASTKNGPVFSLIGSSNMTRPAFSTSKPFNYEADVALWVPQAKGVSTAIQSVLSESSPFDVIRTTYSPNKNGGLSVKDRLTQLRQDILDSTDAF
ncbi:phospholipase D family protein [Klebsiella pneumoniae]|uniref:phospholipase D family protein n=1 Tax=Klebsiella pneumoniae TaxID=573 RepID=UPI000E2E1743|nr:phospholipase D family protein [Klebsiella pneumoniae]SYR60545.1 Uncharacterised protein [Klebsiella pneumoniae]HBY5154950.1 hypothetical protein [Klebsiella pneumoniae]